jgi:phosphoglycerol transferase MdoB-like AlkP superfamily enzyme
LSSHEPFDVPMETVFEGKDDMTKYRNSIFYADRSLGTFIDWAKETSWWKNTLIVLVADHCARVSEEIPQYEQNVFKIPMLWIGGAVAQRGIRINKLGSQVDIPLTILNQLGIKGNFPFAKDLLSDESRSFAFYTFNEGFGFITDSSAFFYDQKLKKQVSETGKAPEYAGLNGKAYLQVLFNDYLKR